MALENSKGERKIARYVKNNLRLIQNSLNEWSWNCVVNAP